MIDRINEIQARIAQIRSGSTNISNFKPEGLKEFEQMLHEINMTNQPAIEKNDSLAGESVIPVLQDSQLEFNSLPDMVSLQQENNKGINKSGEIDALIKQASGKFKVAEDLIRAVIEHESAYQNKAVSKSGAQGLMQLMPGTARDMGVTDPFDPEQNILGGTRYLRQMLDRYDGDLDKALAAYNAGPTRVDQSGGIPDIAETRNYIKSIKKTLTGGE
jgi:soluble lytic murein transglycosylase-like protein